MPVKKHLELDERAIKELKAFPDQVQAKFTALFILLEKEGFLKEPYAKRLNEKLFELRVRHEGQWRAVYGYLGKTSILIISAFRKKTQKTPEQELKTALKRLREYE